MRLTATILCLIWANPGLAQDRFGDWVAAQLGYQPFYTQSIGWDMREPAVQAHDPLAPPDTALQFIQTPDSTAWLVGIMQDASDARLSGMALVWSDGPFDRTVALTATQTRSGMIAFQTPQRPLTMDGVPEAVAEQMAEFTPGPILAKWPEGSIFAVGDSGLPNGCLQMHALYSNTVDLVALVILFQSNLRDDPDTTPCSPLTS